MLRRLTPFVFAVAATSSLIGGFATSAFATDNAPEDDDGVVTVMTAPVLERTPMLCVAGPRDPDWDPQTCVSDRWDLKFSVPDYARRAVVTVTALTANVPQAEECAEVAVADERATVCAVRPDTAPPSAVLNVRVATGTEAVAVNIRHVGDALPTPAESPGSMNVDISVSFAVVPQQVPPTTVPPTTVPPTTVAPPTTEPPATEPPIVDEPAETIPPTLPHTGTATDRSSMYGVAMIVLGLGLVIGRRLVHRTVVDLD
ncbi:MAG: hypothetical protein AB7L13_09345 [Acidimicrobiia bacterium]